MTQPTQPLDLDAIEARANAAFEGPWEHSQTQEDTPVVYAPQTTSKGTEYAHVLFEADWGKDADAAFIAAARTDVTALVAEVRRLRARTLTESEHNRAWHAIEGAAGEEGADPGTVLNAVLRALGINPPAEEVHVVADDSDDPEHIDDCPGCQPAA